jgi:hypothetical protein
MAASPEDPCKNRGPIGRDERRAGPPRVNLASIFISLSEYEAREKSHPGCSATFIFPFSFFRFELQSGGEKGLGLFVAHELASTICRRLDARSHVQGRGEPTKHFLQLLRNSFPGPGFWLKQRDSDFVFLFQPFVLTYTTNPTVVLRPPPTTKSSLHATTTILTYLLTILVTRSLPLPLCIISSIPSLLQRRRTARKNHPGLQYPTHVTRLILAHF